MLIAWVKIKAPGDRRFWSLVPFVTRVPTWIPIFDPQPYCNPYIQLWCPSSLLFLPFFGEGSPFKSTNPEEDAFSVHGVWASVRRLCCSFLILKVTPKIKVVDIL